MTALAALGIFADPHGPKQQRAACPRCAIGKRDDALSVNIQSGLFHCFRCGWKGRADRVTTAPWPIQRIDDSVTRERKRARLSKRWAQAVALENLQASAVVCKYLRTRGFSDALRSSALRQHNALLYWDRLQVVAHYPALLAEIRDPTGTVVGHHATYLRADGCAKAPVAAPRKIITRTSMNDSAASPARRIPHETGDAK
jgi:hypothetical protein